MQTLKLGKRYPHLCCGKLCAICRWVAEHAYWERKDA
jgi:hypothetical protein